MQSEVIKLKIDCFLSRMLMSHHLYIHPTPTVNSMSLPSPRLYRIHRALWRGNLGTLGTFSSLSVGITVMVDWNLKNCFFFV